MNHRLTNRQSNKIISFYDKTTDTTGDKYHILNEINNVRLPAISTIQISTKNLYYIHDPSINKLTLYTIIFSFYDEPPAK